MSHTPGPWTLEQIEDVFFVRGANGDLVETIYTGEANAKLIAAAPDLFAALKAVSLAKRTEHLPVEVVIAMMEALDKVEPWDESKLGG